jgi:2-polyprenyl-3-methyl-5-hydroxy-6-metoxy-1,4-benzoquinol methylase
MLYDRKIKEKALREIEQYGPAPTHHAMVRLTGPHKTVLELGCATGYVSKMLKENGCSVAGIELDPEAAETARQYCDAVIVADLNNPEILAGMNQKFDCILCGDILEHLLEPDKILLQCKSLLVENGFILVSLPNIAYWRMRLDLLLGRFNYQDTGLLDRTHLRFFTVNSFKKLILDCGYRLSEFEINEAGFPFSKLLFRVPGIGSLARTMSHWGAACAPNLFVFHAIYKLKINSKHPSEIDDA